jgi:hypothetical protein
MMMMIMNMMMPTRTSFLCLLVGLATVQAQGSDYIAQAPKTVYERTVQSPQNMDFDLVNNQFIAHAGWYNGKDIHYYKFRMYTPGTYSGVIAPGSTAADVPLQKIYLVTKDGTFNGVVGSPILEYHHSDGLVYSDFMEVVFVEAPNNYVVDEFKSTGDIEDSGATLTESGTILNFPLVPTGSTLQDPATGGTDAAPINPVIVWYKGVQVWCYVFEVTTIMAAFHFSGTRSQTDKGYAIPVVEFASSSAVQAIPVRIIRSILFYLPCLNTRLTQIPTPSFHLLRVVVALESILARCCCRWY